MGDKIAAKALANQVKLGASLGATGKSAKELQFALRGLPAQITDIGVSLASGQRPLMVLLQQGGQLKDMFGGIVPAAKALGSSLLALINPYTLTAAAIVAIGAAWNSAENDAAAFNKALIVTGNYAGKTATQLEAMVGSIATTANASSGSAREALQKVAETGRFTGEQFNLVAIAAARMESATGQSIDDTIKKFEDLGKSPVDALLKLNDTEHFLTQAQLDRVRALQEEGKEQEAAAEAARIYAGRLDEVADAAEAARPHLSKMWKEAKDGASAAWAETKNFVEFLAAASEKAQKIPWYQRMSAVGGLRAGIAGLYGAEPTPPTTVKPVAGAIDSNRARDAQKIAEEAAKLKDKYLTREEEKKQAIAELDRLRSQYSETEYQNLKKQIELRFADKTGGTARKSKAGPDFSREDQKSIKDEIAAQGKLDDQMARGTAAVAAYKAGLADMLQTRKASIDLQVASVGMGRKEIEQTQALISIDADYNRKKADLQRRQQSTTDALEKNFYAEQLEALEKYHNDRVQIEKEGFARSDAARADAMNGVRSAIKDFMAEQQDMAGQMNSLTTNFLDGLGDAFADFASGAKSAKDAFGDLIDSMYRQALKFLANKAIQALFDSFGSAGTSSTPGSTAGGWGSIAGNLVNAFSSKGGGLANGGPAAAGSMHEVAENGPELLNIGRRSYLLMGNQSGHVTPIKDDGGKARGGATYITNIAVQPTSTRRTADQVADANARKLRIAQSRNA